MRYVIILIIFLFAIAQFATAKIINVPVDFKGIQQAIDAASPNDIVLVSSGAYKESIEIKKNIKLIGAGSDRTTLLGLISISKAKVEVSGFRIEGSGKDAHFGIWCESSSAVITKNVIVSFHHCIGSEGSTIIVENNELTKSLNAGIIIGSAIDAQIKSNQITDNLDVGILVALSDDNVSVSDNVITKNRIGIGCSESKPKIRRNVITNNQIGVQTDNKDVPDMGTEKDPGMNIIKNNGIHIANLDRKHTLMAEGNYWGNPGGPKETDFDGNVDYNPWLKSDPMVSQSVEPKYHIPSTWGRLKQNS